MNDYFSAIESIRLLEKEARRVYMTDENLSNGNELISLKIEIANNKTNLYGLKEKYEKSINNVSSVFQHMLGVWRNFEEKTQLLKLK